jgi:uncharacterized protein YndB with AHSA1/START domain
MGIKTQVEIDIAAPPEAVFQWLTQREKVAQWAGADPTYMPSDGSELTAGYRSRGTFHAPDGDREVDFEITAYEPPALFAYRNSYAGGDQTSTYRLNPAGAGTHLELSADTDYAQMGALPAAQQEQLAKLPAAMRALVQHNIERMEKQLEAHAFDDNPALTAAMAQQTKTMLEKLKQLVEAEVS